MEEILVHPATPSPDLVKTLELAGWAWRGADTVDEALGHLASGELRAVIVSGDEGGDRFVSFCRAIRNNEPSPPILALVRGGELASLQSHVELIDDFCLMPCHPAELEARMAHLMARAGSVRKESLIEHGQLVLNPDSYEAAIAGHALELTHMEYELLRHLASNPGRVFTRETLLSQVWGYDYFGGARTVDVHVRRLRAKLGDDHAGLIQTVRSVGYSFGESGWKP